MCGHFRPHDKDGGRTIRSAISENPVLHASFTAVGLCVIELELCRSKSYIVEIRIFELFCSCDLDLDPMIFTYELYPYSVKMYWRTKRVKALESYHITDRPTYIHTVHTYIDTPPNIPRRFAGSQKMHLKTYFVAFRSFFCSCNLNQMIFIYELYPYCMLPSPTEQHLAFKYPIGDEDTPPECVCSSSPSFWSRDTVTHLRA